MQYFQTEVLSENSSNHNNYYEIQAGDLFILNYEHKFVAYEVTKIKERADNEGWTKSVNLEGWMFYDTSNKKMG